MEPYDEWEPMREYMEEEFGKIYSDNSSSDDSGKSAADIWPKICAKFREKGIRWPEAEKYMKEAYMKIKFRPKLERYIYSLIKYRAKKNMKDYAEWEPIRKYLKKDFESIKRSSSSGSSAHGASPGTAAWVNLVEDVVQQGLGWASIEKELEPAYKQAVRRIVPQISIEDLLAEGHIRSNIMKHMSVADIHKLLGKNNWNFSNDEALELIHQLNDPTSATLQSVFSWTVNIDHHWAILRILNLKAHTKDGQMVQFDINTHDAQGRTVFFGMLLCLIRTIFEEYTFPVRDSEIEQIKRTILYIWDQRPDLDITIPCFTLDFNKQRNSIQLMKPIREIFRFIAKPFRHTAFSLIIYHLCIKNMGGWGPLYSSDIFKGLLDLVKIALARYPVNQLYLQSKPMRDGLYGKGIDPKLVAGRPENLSRDFTEITNVWIVENADDELFQLLNEHGLDFDVSGVTKGRSVKQVLQEEVVETTKYLHLMYNKDTQERREKYKKDITKLEETINSIGNTLLYIYKIDNIKDKQYRPIEEFYYPYCYKEMDEILPEGKFNLITKLCIIPEYKDYYNAHKKLGELKEDERFPRTSSIIANDRLDRANRRAEVNIAQAGGRRKITKIHNKK